MNENVFLSHAEMLKLPKIMTLSLMVLIKITLSLMTLSKMT